MKMTIVGSMEFHDKYRTIKRDLEMKGHEVVIPLKDEFYKNEENPKRKSMEDFNYNLEKSDAILVVNYDKNRYSNYIGVNSLMEIGMAFNKDKRIFILNDIPENCKDELEAIGVNVLKGNLEAII